MRLQWWPETLIIWRTGQGLVSVFTTGDIIINLCKKSTEKKFLEKNLEIKTLVKMSQFSEVLGQNVKGNKVLSSRFLGLFS